MQMSVRAIPPFDFFDFVTTAACISESKTFQLNAYGLPGGLEFALTFDSFQISGPYCVILLESLDRSTVIAYFPECFLS
jgi:hypothetical protein